MKYIISQSVTYVVVLMCNLCALVGPNIAHHAEKVRHITPFRRTYLKKDNKTLKATLIIAETATYILLKTHMGHTRQLGGEKSATYALRVPIDTNEDPSRVCQLVSHDSLNQHSREEFSKEFSLQSQLAQDGIAPKVLGIFDYTKTTKSGLHINKRTAFVEAFDHDLYAFDPLAKADSGLPPLNQKEIFSVAKSIAKHLQILHEKNIVHFDIGLENVGVCFNPQKKEVEKVFLIDFGLSFKTTNAPPYPQNMYGHIPVTGPEFFRQEPIDDYTKCDIYALGALLSMLVINPDSELDPEFEPEWIGDLTNLEDLVKEEQRPPTSYTAEITQILQLQEEYSSISERARDAIEDPIDLDSFLKAFISICLHPDPSKRPSAKELIGYCKKINSS